jgi:hypothetical protein
LERIATIPARVTVNASGTEALIVFHEGGVERSIRGVDCEQVASAAALIVAVALGSSPREAPAETSQRREGPEGLLERRPPSTASGDLTPPAPAAKPATRGAVVQTRATVATASRALEPAPRASSSAARIAPAASEEAPTVPDARIDAPSSSPAPPRRGTSLALGAAAEANGWVGPWPAGVINVSLDISWPALGWSARIAAVYGAAERIVDERRAEFNYWGGHLDLCPVTIGSVASWQWTNCAELHLGLLHAAGDERSALSTGFSQRALLAAGVIATRLRTPPLWAIRLELETGVAVPLVRQTFHFDAPERVIFESPVIGLLARAGLVVPLDGGRLD